MLKEIVRKRLNKTCDLCDICNGEACKGRIPGLGGYANNEAFIRNFIKLKEYKIDNKKNIKISNNFLGKSISNPVFIAPITGAEENFGNYLTHFEYAFFVAKAAIELNIIPFFGDGIEDEKYLSGCYANKCLNANGVFIIKPWKDNSKIINKIRLAEKFNALAVGCDIDSVKLPTMTKKNANLSLKKFKDLKEIISSTHLPFIVKGILDVETAEMAYKAGANAIIISNHGGRVDNTLKSAIEVLPEISKKFKDKMTIIVDGGIREREHVYKYLHAGAQFVLIGRPVIWGALFSGSTGIKNAIKKFLI